MSHSRLVPTPFDPQSLVRGDDGELYHLPTLRALHAAGRLSTDSAALRLVLHHQPLHTRLTA